MKKPLSWSYGVTTCPVRRKDLLPRTLASLARAGFDRPRLFVDGDWDARGWENEFRLEVTARHPVVGVAGNWILTLVELYHRLPGAERFAIFQDDLTCVTNLRAYLEACPYPDRGYLNLFSFMDNERLLTQPGWLLANQKGRGAVALVFSREAAMTLLCQRHLVQRTQHPKWGKRKIDGGVVEAMKIAGWQEWIHNPSLVQHTGHRSSMGNSPHPVALSFPGEDFDPLPLLKR